MPTKTKERDLKAWYMAAVKGDLVLNYGLMPKEADIAICYVITKLCLA